MVNMNHHEDPAIYGLTAPDGGVFYVGRTSVNALNRWWQHKSRAASGHEAPVYARMREVGIENTSWVIVERYGDIPDGISPRDREAWWIAKYIEAGADLVNSNGRDGVPDSWSSQQKERGVPSRKGKLTWIKGLTGEDAGWTDDRREAQSIRTKMRLWKREIDNPELLFARILKMEKREMRVVQREAAKSKYFLPKEPRAPKITATHGTRTMWEKYKCKCQPCRDAGARRNAKKRGNPDWESVTAAPIAEAEYKIHGTWNCYKHGNCRCDDCLAAARQHRLDSKTV